MRGPPPSSAEFRFAPAASTLLPSRRLAVGARGGHMVARTLRSLCDDRSFKFGHFVVEFATPGIGHIRAGAGCEFVLFDTEHSGFSTDVVRSCVRYFEAAELPAIFRVPSKSYDHLARYADMGAEGLMVPLVDDAREAE